MHAHHLVDGLYALGCGDCPADICGIQVIRYSPHMQMRNCALMRFAPGVLKYVAGWILYFNLMLIAI